MRRLFFILYFLSGWLLPHFGEAQKITGIDRKTGTANGTMGISGTGFGTDKNILKVSFGPSLAEIVGVSDNSLTVKLPPGATFHSITVTNTSTGISSTSKDYFLLSFGGKGFDPGQLAGAVKYTAESGFNEHCLCDFNNDGLTDVAGANAAFDNLSIFKNASTLDAVSFIKQNVSVSSTSYNITCEDLDGDGLKDLIASKGGNEGYQLFVLRNESIGNNIAFGPFGSYFAAGKLIRKIITKDLDGDGKPELIVSSEASEILSIFPNQSTPGNINFPPAPKQITVNGTFSTHCLAVEDLNSDGLPEIIANVNLGQDLFILRNKSSLGNIGFDPAQKVNVPSGMGQFRIGDLNQDGLHDLAIANSQTGRLMVMFNETAVGNSTFTMSKVFEYAATAGAWGVDLGDLDGDSRVDVILSTADPVKNLAVLRNVSGVDSLVFERSVIVSSEPSKSIKIADINNDGKPDISYVGTETPAFVVLQNKNCISPEIISNNPLVVCKGVPLRLSVPEGIGVKYQWMKNNSAVVGADKYFLDVIETGLYKVSISNVDGSCQKVSADTAVLIIDPSNPSASPITILNDTTAICPSDSITLTVEADFLGYTWSTGEKTKTILVNRAEKYTVEVKVFGGCTANGEVEITHLPAPVVSIEADKNRVRRGEVVQLRAQGASEFRWDFSNSLSDSTIANPTVSPVATTTYKVRGINGSGCIDEEEITITVEDGKINLSPPKIFTPNGDGVSDLWVIENIESYSRYQVTVFSNSAQVVFKASPYNNNWDGTLNGKILPEGDYFYLINSAESKDFKAGSVRLIR